MRQMSVYRVPASETIYDRILRRIQKQLANRVKIPFAIRLWGDRVYRFGEGEPAVDILVRDPKGLAALGRLDELGLEETGLEVRLNGVYAVESGVLPPDLPVVQSQHRPRLKPLGKAIRPGRAEVDHNPRARSAVLRVAERLQ